MVTSSTGEAPVSRFSLRLPLTVKRRLIGAAVCFGLLMWVVSGAMGGAKGAGLASLIAVGVTVGLMARPGIRGWLMESSPTGDVTHHEHSVFLRDLAARCTATPLREFVSAAVLLGLTTVVAIAAGMIGEKALIIVIGLLALLGMVALIKNRTLFFMFVFAASFSLIWYKKFTPFLAESYAVAIYITTVDVVLLFLYFIWAGEGTMFRDLRSGLKKPVFLLPVSGIAITLLSAVNALDQRIVWAEIVRYLWMTALFIYVAVRVRRREHLWAFMLGWLVFLSVQVIVSMSQRFTGGFLGIELFALRPDPMEPNSLEFMRPFGTQIHPVFLGCVVAMVSLMVGCFALHVPRSSIMRWGLLGCIPLSVASAYLSKARGPLVALVPAVAVVVIFAVRRKFLSPRVLLVGAILAAIGAAAFQPQISSLVGSMFGSESNASENWNARWQINEIAFRMVEDHPFVGIGINSFESQIPNYTKEENPFDFRPAHNLYILMAAETGFIGLGLMLVVGLVYLRYAYRLTRSDDPMFVTLGIGAIAVMTFIAFEELNSFTLKQDIPMAMFWTIFGMLVAADRMVHEGTPELPRLSWVKPRAGVADRATTDSIEDDRELELAGVDR